MARSKLEIVIEAQNQAKRQLDNLGDQLKRIGDEQKDFAESTDAARQSFLGFTSSISAGVLAANAIQGILSTVTRGFTSFIKGAISTSLSVERISATLPILAKNTGKTTKEINSIIFAIREENKSIREATEVTRGIVLAGLEQVDALRLIKVARDVGATVGRTSADVNRLILESFTTLTPGILKQVGLNISLREVYRDLASQLGKNVAELTTLERQTGLFNAIMVEGAKFGGAYEAAMGTVQKQLGSVKDASVDILQVFGDLITGGFFPIVNQALLAVRAFRAWAFTSENELNPTLVALQDRITTLVLTTFNALVTTVKFLIQIFREFFDMLKEKGIIESFNEILEATGQIIRDTVIPVIKFLFGDVETLKIVLAATFAVIAVALIAVLAPLVIAVTAITLAVTGLVVIIRVLKKAFTEIILFFILFQDSLVASFNAVRESFVSEFGIIRDTFFQVWNAIKNFFANIWQNMRETAFGALNDILEKIKNVISGITNIPAKFGGGAIDLLKGLIPGNMANGGIVTRPTIARIGEAGPEAVIPLNRLGLGGGGANIIINFNGGVFGEDADRVGKEVGDAIIERLGLNIRIG
ncbi:hypothetical protein LCGC14_1220880 [marine sediment metagenome]|uniref:Phage tail tape measure protein domain-containing protein n=1 Tax=marine sediment metagenome TaxID=412755 RepID=A0A0F9NTL0_9ZZZZ